MEIVDNNRTIYSMLVNILHGMKEDSIPNHGFPSTGYPITTKDITIFFCTTAMLDGSCGQDLFSLGILVTRDRWVTILVCDTGSEIIIIEDHLFSGYEPLCFPDLHHTLPSIIICILFFISRWLIHAPLRQPEKRV